MPNRSIISVSICIALHMLKTNVCHITFYRRLTKWIFYVLLRLLWETFSEIFLSESTLNSIKCIKLTRITKIVWEKLDRNPDWTVIMIKYIYICVFFFFTKVSFNANKYFFSHSSVPFPNFSFTTLWGRVLNFVW